MTDSNYFKTPEERAEASRAELREVLDMAVAFERKLKKQKLHALVDEFNTVFYAAYGAGSSSTRPVGH